MEWMRSTLLKYIPVHTWGVPNFEPLSCMLGLYDVSKYSVSIMVSKTASKVRIIMLFFKKRWLFTDLFNCKWRGLLFLPSVIRKEVKCSMPFHRSLKLLSTGTTNDLTYCYSCITESIMVSEAFNGSNTLTVTENIFLGHYSYSVKNVSYWFIWL